MNVFIPALASETALEMALLEIALFRFMISSNSASLKGVRESMSLQNNTNALRQEKKVLFWLGLLQTHKVRGAVSVSSNQVLVTVNLLCSLALKDHSTLGPKKNALFQNHGSQQADTSPTLDHLYRASAEQCFSHQPTLRLSRAQSHILQGV